MYNIDMKFLWKALLYNRAAKNLAFHDTNGRPVKGNRI